MHPELIESMHDQVRSIYRTVTGSDLPQVQVPDAQSEVPIEEVTRSFAELEALVRATPNLAQHLPMFSFTPALDAFLDGSDLVVEVAVPGVERKQVSVEVADGTLIVSGVRRGPSAAAAASYSHAEIPCGPFLRSFSPPLPTSGDPSVELNRGLLRIRLKCSIEDKPKEETPQRHSNPQ